MVSVILKIGSISDVKSEDTSSTFEMIFKEIAFGLWYRPRFGSRVLLLLCKVLEGIKDLVI